jgi:hypothetical protein
MSDCVRFCECGCGVPVTNRFVRGHNYRGVTRGPFTPERLAAYRRQRTDAGRAPRATTKPTLSDLAWAAGFIEGEGSFKHSSSSLCADQVQREPLERLQRFFGGSIYAKTHPSMGPRRLPSRRWTINGGRARGVMLTLYSWLSPRRRQQLLRSL